MNYPNQIKFNRDEDQIIYHFQGVKHGMAAYCIERPSRGDKLGRRKLYTKAAVAELIEMADEIC